MNRVNADKIVEALGLNWMRKSRLSPLHHMKMINFFKYMKYMSRNKDQLMQKMKLFGEQEQVYGKY